MSTVAPRGGSAAGRTAFLFDLDGTLVDSVYQHVLAWREAMAGVGIKLAVWRIHLKSYSSSQETTRYSPATITGIEKLPIFGEPEEDRISTSHIERMNLSVRMQMRRFTRLTNGHSKSLKHHVAMQALYFAWYNFARKHETLKGNTPAMASGLTDKAWTIRELLEQAAAV